MLRLHPSAIDYVILGQAATHAFNAATFALATVLISGVNLFALARHGRDPQHHLCLGELAMTSEDRPFGVPGTSSEDNRPSTGATDEEEVEAARAAGSTSAG